MIAVTFAHQGGWDEALFVLTPLLVLAWLLRVARKRADAMEAEAGASESARSGATDRGDDAGPDTGD